MTTQFHVNNQKISTSRKIFPQKNFGQTIRKTEKQKNRKTDKQSNRQRVLYKTLTLRVQKKTSNLEHTNTLYIRIS